MISSLISATLAQQDTTMLERIPKFLLAENEKDAISWIVNYKKKFGSCPTTQRMKETDHSVFLTKHLISSPLKDLYQQTLDIKKQDFLLASFHELEAQMDEGGTLDVQEIVDIGRKLSSVNSEEDESLFTIDREELYSEEQQAQLLFGYNTLDKNTGGVQKGEYALLVARTGVGKTLITVHLALKWAKEGKRVLFVSCEMPSAQIVGRIDAILGQFNPRMLRTKDDPTMLVTSLTKVRAELAKIKETGGDIIFPKSQSVSVGSLRGIIADKKPDVVIVDGVYLLRSDDNSPSSDWQKLKGASNELKQICLEQNTPIFATSQLKRTGKEDNYGLEDIAYSDALGQDTDLVLVANKIGGVPNQLSIEIIKNRHGDSYGGTILNINWDKMELSEVLWTEDQVITLSKPPKKTKAIIKPDTISSSDDWSDDND